MRMFSSHPFVEIEISFGLLETIFFLKLVCSMDTILVNGLEKMHVSHSHNSMQIVMNLIMLLIYLKHRELCKN